jgi:hypothetical protein
VVLLTVVHSTNDIKELVNKSNEEKINTGIRKRKVELACVQIFR